MRPFRFAAVLLIIGTTATWAAKSTGPTPVTSTVADVDANGVAHTIQSDGAGEYQNGVAGVDSVLEVTSNGAIPPGDWQLDLSSSTRKLRFTISTNAVPFGQPGYTVTPKPPFTGTLALSGKLENKCVNAGSPLNVDMEEMAAGQVASCPAPLSFFYPTGKRSNHYRFDMTGNAPGAQDPETTEILVTCNSVNTSDGFCDDWFIDPQPAADGNGNVIPGTGIGRLVLVANSGALTNLGDYYLTFHFHITRP